MSKKVRKQKKRNTKSFRKNLNKRTTNQSFVKKVSLNLPKIELGNTKLDFQLSPMDYMMDMMSDSRELSVISNWNRYGVPLLNHNNGTDIHSEIENELKYSSETFLKYGNNGSFYHLTSPKNYSKIMKDGLKSEGVKRMTSMGTTDRIWTIESDSPLIWNQIGYNQLGLGVKNLPIVVLKIDNQGITGRTSSEEIGEFTSPLHTVIHQSFIDKKFITPIGYFLSSRTHFYGIREELGILKSSLYSSQLKMVA
jgi:hypothetical protein